MAVTDVYSVVGDISKTKPAMRFRANATDGVRVDAAIAAMVAGNHTIGTISAWVMVPDNTGTYTIFGAGDASAVEYLHVSIEAGTVWVMMVKATPTTMLDVNTGAGTIKPHTWHHVAIVQDALSGLKIYVDGVDMSLTWTVSTKRSQWVEDLDLLDGAHIGAADSVAGGGALSNEFKGYIGDVRIWSGITSASALSQAQVQQVMSGQVVGAPHNSWSLNRSVVDTGSGADNGTVAGALIYVDANEFISRLSFTAYTLIAATNISMCATNGTACAVFVPSA